MENKRRKTLDTKKGGGNKVLGKESNTADVTMVCDDGQQNQAHKKRKDKMYIMKKGGKDPKKGKQQLMVLLHTLMTRRMKHTKLPRISFHQPDLLMMEKNGKCRAQLLKF